MDTIVLGVLFVLAIAGTASLSTYGGLFSNAAQLGSATIGLGWILTLLVSVFRWT